MVWFCNHSVYTALFSLHHASLRRRFQQVPIAHKQATATAITISTIGFKDPLNVVRTPKYHAGTVAGIVACKEVSKGCRHWRIKISFVVPTFLQGLTSNK